jgi:hypothetical protein
LRVIVVADRCGKRFVRPWREREREYRRQRFLPGMVCPLFRVFQKVEELA